MLVSPGRLSAQFLSMLLSHVTSAAAGSLICVEPPVIASAAADFACGLHVYIRSFHVDCQWSLQLEHACEAWLGVTVLKAVFFQERYAFQEI